MKTTNMFLTGIVIGVILLVGVAFTMALLQPEPTYQPEDTPEAIVHNYLLALQEQDYDRAYSYLSPSLENYPPSAEIFSEDIDDNKWQFGNLEPGSTTLAVISTNQRGERIEVSVRETRFYNRGLFDSSQGTTDFEIELQPENGTWKLVSADSYWLLCWEHEDEYKDGYKDECR